MRFSMKAFTLIELLIVILIVAILASVAVPIMQSQTRSAIATEAISALGAIRTALRLYYTEYDRYTDNLFNLSSLTLRQGAWGTSRSDLDGTYLTQQCYYVDLNCECADGIHPYIIYVYCTSSANPKGVVFEGWENDLTSGDIPVIEMDENGKIYTNIKGVRSDGELIW